MPKLLKIGLTALLLGHASASLSATVTPTTNVKPGDTITVSYNNYVSGDVYICYLSEAWRNGNTGGLTCGAPGTASVISAAVSGTVGATNTGAGGGTADWQTPACTPSAAPDSLELSALASSPPAASSPSV